MRSRPSVMTHRFSQIPQANIQRSHFDRSHGYKTTFDSGYLVPFFVDEVLPGDTFNLRATIFARLATPIYPVMDNMFLETFYFYVPNRLLWDNWERFNGSQDNPGESTDYIVPTLVPSTLGYPVGSIADYMGLPTQVPGLSVTALHFRAYNQIFNEWFRDENLQNSVPKHTDDGPDPGTDYVVLRRGKRHDYFTSCLPWPQKGPGVELPLGGRAPVYGSTTVTAGGIGGGSVAIHGNGSPIGLNDLTAPTNTTYMHSYLSSQGVVGDRAPLNMNVQSTSSGLHQAGLALDYTVSGINGYITDATGLYADLQSATATTINSLRQAFQIQRLYERDARGGTRYTEILRSHFGVVSPDARLQRPEFLGGSSSRIIVSPVAQTQSTNTTSPQGNLAAFGVVSDSRGGFSHSFTEHGVIVGLVNVRADLTYQQGLSRMWSRSTRFDFYWPALAHLGEQAVLNKEIYAQGLATDVNGTLIDNKVFGYQERWAEYRYFPSQITGKFRSTYAQTLDAWHLSQKFDSLPTLSSQFIQDSPPVGRVIAVPSEPQFIMDCYFNLHCARPMPVYSVPGLIDHF